MNAEIAVSDRPDEADRELILTGLVASNARRATSNFALASIVLRDPGTGRTIGGLWGKTLYDWMFVELLFVPDELRGQGYGSKLLAAAERIALERNCLGLWLDTFEFQAPDFYRKNGFEVFGSLQDHPHGMQRFFLRKRLRGGGPDVPSQDTPCAADSGENTPSQSVFQRS